MNESVLLTFFFSLDLVAFLAAIGMHLVKKNGNLVRLYALQSWTVGILLAGIGMLQDTRDLVGVAVLVLGIKGIMAPLFFSRLMRRFHSQFTASNYLNTPLTLFVVMALVMFASSDVFFPLSTIVPQFFGYVSLNLSLVFISIFLMINRRGVFSQMVGILSLENGIVLFAALIGIDQPVALEISIVFDIVIWMVIATAFLSMIYRQFGSLAATELTTLVE